MRERGSGWQENKLRPSKGTCKVGLASAAAGYR